MSSAAGMSSGELLDSWRHPGDAAIAEVCVVALRGPNAVGLRGPNAVGGEQVCAVVPAVPLSPTAAEEEVARLTAGLSGYKRPTLVRLPSGQLPRTGQAVAAAGRRRPHARRGGVGGGGTLTDGHVGHFGWVLGGTTWPLRRTCDWLVATRWRRREERQRAGNDAVA